MKYILLFILDTIWWKSIKRTKKKKKKKKKETRESVDSLTLDVRTTLRDLKMFDWIKKKREKRHSHRTVSTRRKAIYWSKHLEQMTRRKYVVHEYSADRSKTGSTRSRSRQRPKDQSLVTRVKVSSTFFHFDFRFWTNKEKKEQIDVSFTDTKL